MRTETLTVIIPAEEYRRLKEFATSRNLEPENVASLWIANDIRRKTPRLPPPPSDADQPHLIEGTTDPGSHYDGGF